MNNIEIHPLTILIGFLAVITGLFKEFSILVIIIIVHEIGHLIMANYYGWPINKIYLYPFGGHIKFKAHINCSINEELWITMMGFIMQIIFYLFIKLNYEFNLISYTTLMLVKNYHYAILFFNLLPIYPLDGSKLINLWYATILPFKMSHKIMVYSSYLFIFTLIAIIIRYYLNFNLLLICFLLITKITEELKNHHYLFYRFLLERYLYKFDFKKLKIIYGDKLEKMVRDKRHLFLIDKKYETEKQLLHQKFRT